MLSKTLVIVCGVRPHYVKAAALVECLRGSGVRTAVVDARQQYDPGLTTTVSEGLGLAFDVTFNHDSLDAAVRASSVYVQLRHLIQDAAIEGERGKVILGFGDAVSTMMAAVAAASEGVPFVHFEAGVRALGSVVSVEDQFRRAISQMSSLNLCMLEQHTANLVSERAPGVSVVVGDLAGEKVFRQRISNTEMVDEVLCHIHKAENVTYEGVLAILEAIRSTGYPCTFITHPAVGRIIDEGDIAIPTNVRLRKPTSHDIFVELVCRSRIVLTDSGGVQREAFRAGRRCVVRRDSAGWGALFGPGGHIRVDRTQRLIKDALTAAWNYPQWELNSPFDGLIRDGVPVLVRELSEIVRAA